MITGDYKIALLALLLLVIVVAYREGYRRGKKMGFHAGVHVLHPDQGNDIVPAGDNGVDNDIRDDSIPLRKAGRPKGRRSRSSQAETPENESVPQDASQLNGTDPTGDVGGITA